MKFYVLPENALLELKIQDKSLKEMMHLSSLVNRQISFNYKLTFLQFLQGRYPYFESFLISVSTDGYLGPPPCKKWSSF